MFCDDSERPIVDVETIYKFSSLKQQITWTYSEPRQAFMIELFVKVVHGFQPFLSLFSKRSILDVGIGSEWTSGLYVEYI